MLSDVNKSAALNCILLVLLNMDGYAIHKNTVTKGLHLLIKNIFNEMKKAEIENFFLIENDQNLNTLHYNYLTMNDFSEVYQKLLNSKKYDSKAIGESLTHILKNVDEASMMHMCQNFTRLDSEIYKAMQLIQKQRDEIQEENLKIQNIQDLILQNSFLDNFRTSVQQRFKILFKFLLGKQISTQEYLDCYFESVTRSEKKIECINNIYLSESLKQVVFLMSCCSLNSPDRNQERLSNFAKTLILGGKISSQCKNVFNNLFIYNACMNYISQEQEKKQQQQQEVSQAPMQHPVSPPYVPQSPEYWQPPQSQEQQQVEESQQPQQQQPQQSQQLQQQQSQQPQQQQPQQSQQLQQQQPQLPQQQQPLQSQQLQQQQPQQPQQQQSHQSHQLQQQQQSGYHLLSKESFSRGYQQRNPKYYPKYQPRMNHQNRFGSMYQHRRPHFQQKYCKYCREEVNTSYRNHNLVCQYSNNLYSEIEKFCQE